LLFPDIMGFNHTGLIRIQTLTKIIRIYNLEYFI
jgi:hypothetical protein